MKEQDRIDEMMKQTDPLIEAIRRFLEATA